jgi:hypothetical protein
MSSFVGSFWDDVDPFGSYSIKDQMELINETNKGFKKKKPSKPKPQDDGFDSDFEQPMKLNKKRKEFSSKIEPLDNKTLDLRNKQRKTRRRNCADDECQVDNSIDDLGGIVNPIGVPERPPVHYIPLSKMHARYNEYENEEIYSSCEELDDSEDESNNNDATSNYKPIDESTRILQIMKGKNIELLGEEEGKDDEKEKSDEKADEEESFHLTPNILSPIAIVTDPVRTKDNSDVIFESLQRFHESIKPKGKRSKICFGCMFGSKADGSIDSTPFNTLMEIIGTNYGSIGNRFLARVAHCYFQNHIRKPMLLRGKKIPNWKTVDILDHIETHTIHPVMHTGQAISRCKKIGGILQNMIFKVRYTPTGQEIFEVDKGNLKVLLDVEKTILMLYKTNVKEMLFYTDSFKVDPATMGKFMNLNKEIEFSK